MWKFIEEGLKEKWRGFIGGCFAGGGILWTNKDLLLKGILPLFIVFVSGFLGAMGTALWQDVQSGKFSKRVKKIYNKIKKLFTKKQKENGQQQSDEERAA